MKLSHIHSLLDNPIIMADPGRVGGGLQIHQALDMPRQELSLFDRRTPGSERSHDSPKAGPNLHNTEEHPFNHGRQGIFPPRKNGTTPMKAFNFVTALGI